MDIKTEVLFQMIGEQQVTLRMVGDKLKELVEQNKQLTERLKKHETTEDN